MLITMLRVLIVYIIVVAAVRLMGKRQIGEMQPTELVITILLSEIAAIPIQDNDLPILNSIIAVLLLVSFEIINSVISMKSNKYRSILQGNSLIVIRNGIIDQKQIKRLRLSVDDLLESLREEGVFDLSEVEYAILETNGKLSTLLKPKSRPVTAEMLNVEVSDSGMPFVVAYDGKIMKDNFKECNLNMDTFNNIVSHERIKIKEILLMTVDNSGKATIIRKEN